MDLHLNGCDSKIAKEKVFSLCYNKATIILCVYNIGAKQESDNKLL
jgi:hypothetical protein